MEPGPTSSAAASPLDIERADHLLAYLRGSGLVGPHEQPGFRILRGGVSSRCVLVEREGRDAWVVKQSLPRLRVEVEWYSSPLRIRREALGLKWLAGLTPPGTVPALVWEDEQHHLLGMEAVPRPHQNWKELLLRGRVEPTHVLAWGRLLGMVHRGGWERRRELEPVFADDTFFESLRLEPYYRYTAERVPEAATFLLGLADDTRRRRLTVVHGDYSPKNVLVREGRLVLLDHEVVHFGDPAFDLGFSLAHLLSKAHHLPEHRRAFVAAARRYWAAYRDALGEVPWSADLEPRAVRHALACLLARAAGRSPLEYLDAAERARQTRVVLDLLREEVESLPALLSGWQRRLEVGGADH